MDSTIRDVAERAQVSTATVSRIVNNKAGGFSDETRQRVLKAIEELGYQPNGLARGLVQKQTRTIGVVFPFVSTMFSGAVLSGVEDAAHAADFSVIVCKTDGDFSRTLKYLQLLTEKRVEGIIFVSDLLQDTYHEILKRARIPVTLVSTFSDRHDVPHVRCDDRRATFSGTEYLIGQGHTRIGMLCGDKNDPVAGIPRVEGYRDALRAHGLPFVAEHVVYLHGFDFKEGRRGAAELLGGQRNLTAILASSDEMAMGAISQAYALGLRVPEDLSVMGYDNTAIAEMCVPPLTTVGQPLYDMGRRAAQTLLELTSGKAAKVKSTLMPHTIVERASVRPLRDTSPPRT